MRYPDDIVENGISARISFEALVDRAGSEEVGRQRGVPDYLLPVGALDEFMAALWKESGLNIKAFMTWNPAAREYLERGNNWVFR